MFCTIQLSKSDPTPLYIQLASELAKLIKTGDLPANTKLPTIRSLSRTLCINRDTVVSAYKLLENQGLIIAYVGNGTYVSPQQFSKDPQTPAPIACSSLSFPKNFFSKKLLQDIISDVVSNEGWDAFSDPLHREKGAIREAIAEYLRSVGIDAISAQLRLVQHFSKFLLDLLKLHPEHCICIEAYHDLTYTSFLRSLGIKLIEIPMTSEGMDLDILEETLRTHAVSFIWVSSYIQNPTGVSYSEQNKRRLLALANAHHCYILEDGTYSDFVYADTALKPLYQMDTDDLVIYFYHFSKLYLPHLQYSFIALPSHLSSRLLDPSEYTFNERVLYFYMKSAAFDQLRVYLVHTNHLFYQKVLAVLDKASDVFEIYETHTGPFFWIKPRLHTVSEVSNIFLKNHIIISPGELFSFKSQCPYFRLSLTQLNEETLPLLLKSLHELSAKGQ